MRTDYHPNKDNLSPNYSSQYLPTRHSILGKKKNINADKMPEILR